MKQQTLLDRPVSHLLDRLDWEKALYIVLLIVVLSTRLWRVGDRVQSHDEAIHTKYSWNLYAGYGFQHNPLMHGPFLFDVTALTYFLFGDNDFTARVPVALMGTVIAVVFPYLLRRWLGRPGALATAFFLLISPSIAYYSRYIRHDIPVILWSLLTIYSMFSYLRDGRARWLYLMGAGVSLMFAAKEVAFIYDAIFGLFLVGLFAVQALQREWAHERGKSVFWIALVPLAIGGATLGLGLALKSAEQPALAWWAIAGGMLAGLGLLVALASLLAGTWYELRSYRSFDLIIVLGTLCFPFLSPVPIMLAKMNPIDYSAPTIYYSGAITAVMVLISAGIGLAWNWRRWGITAIVFYAIFLVLFTTVFTNGTGIASGLVGSLGYWLAQQEVERGGQPWYYYIITVLLYEYLPLFLAIVAGGYLAVRRLIAPHSNESAPHPSPLPGEERGSAPHPGPLAEGEREGVSSNLQSPISDPQSSFLIPHSSFLPFLLWWIVMAWVTYSYAGEKMPWLTTHVALPMILLSGWLVGRLIEGTDWRRVFQKQAWLLALTVPPFVAALVVFVSAASAGPFRGYELAQLNTTGQFLGGLLGVLAFGAGLGYLIWRSGWRVAWRVLVIVLILVPVFLTIHTTWRFCYVNGDYPTEFLVYAHSGPAVKQAMDQIEELSRRVAGGPNLIKVAYGSDGSTVFYWYLRNYRNAAFYGEQPSREALDAPVVIAGQDQWDEVSPYMADNYVVNRYTYLWWPVEDYRNLTWERIRQAIVDPQTRAAWLDIWYDRDYRRYDEVTGTKHTLDEWPLRADFRLYIRRDVVEQMWDLGTTEPVEIGPTDPYAKGWLDLAARQVFGSQGAGPGQFQGPHGITVGPDGFIYVADSDNHRIQKFTADGQFVAAWGEHSTAETEVGEAQGFNQPWDVAVAADGAIYVADTWNHRIQKLDAGGNLVAAWGIFGQYGPQDAGGESAFYGPRGVAVGPNGRVYVTDTGNKRVQVFEPDGKFASQWGGGGVLDGYLDEPVGIAISPGGEVYVADTWNRRVQVFNSNGTYLRQWPIVGWDTGLPDEKPYLAVDNNEYVYVTDPGHYRVLVFDSLGNYVLSFGRYGFDERSFALPGGIAVAQDGTIYVTDAAGGRALVFDPLNLNETMNNEQ